MEGVFCRQKLHDASHVYSLWKGCDSTITYMLIVFVVFLWIILLALFNLDELGRDLLDDRLS